MRYGLKIVGKSLFFAVIALCLAATIIPPFLDRVYYTGPKSAHFNGAHFSNPDAG
jgi:hypothetical protein